MVISFPILISETVDKDILPYMLKSIERKFAVDYIPILEKMVKQELDAHTESKDLEGVIIEDEYQSLKSPLLETSYGIQVIPGETNKLNNDQPYFLTLRITTSDRVTHDFVFGFKALSLVTPDALKIFIDELSDSRYYIHRTIRRLFTQNFIWKMYKWYNKVFNRDYTKTQEWEAKKILFSETKERLCVLSVNDVSKEEFENNDGDYIPLSSDNLKKSRWSGLYLDDSLNKKFYVWDEKTPKFSMVFTYDILHKMALGVLPEQVQKAKQKSEFLMSRKLPADNVFNKAFEGKL